VRAEPKRFAKIKSSFYENEPSAWPGAVHFRFVSTSFSIKIANAMINVIVSYVLNGLTSLRRLGEPSLTALISILYRRAPDVNF
jgi:hypothetical protein